MANAVREISQESKYIRKARQSIKASISVTSPELSGTGRHIIYKISGKDPEGLFEVFRRYKDFIAVRRLLQLNWPLCLIPQIPPKKFLVISI